MSDPATSLSASWLAELPIWLQHRDKVPHYSGSRPRPRTGLLDTPEDRAKLVPFRDLKLAEGFEPGYALGPLADGRVVCGVDLDKCFDANGKVIEPLKEFCNVARVTGAMIEVSRSGHGLHVVWLAPADAVPPTFKRAGIESYTRGRFFAWGSKLVAPGAPTPLIMTPAYDLLPVTKLTEAKPVEKTDDGLVPLGGRNNYLREKLEDFVYAGLSGEVLKQAIFDQNAKLADPLDEEEIKATIFKGIDKLYIKPKSSPSEVFDVVEVIEKKAPSLARPLGDGADFDYDVVYHLIDSVLPVGGLTMLWGESTAGKSFLALDWCLHLVYGREWHGRKVRPSKVWYMAGEGEIGLKKRVVAWRKFHGIAEPTGSRFMIHNLQHVTAFEALKVEAYDVPQCDLIVIDTLNRWSDGDENDASDMGAWLRVAQSLAVKAGNAAVLIVHHARKDGDQYRGSTAIKAAVDAEFEIAGTREAVTVTHRKSKDEEMLDEMVLMKRVVELGVKDDGFGGTKVHTSLVFEAATPAEEKTVEMSLEDKIIAALRKCGGEVSSRNGLLELVDGRRELVLARVREMLARGTLENVGQYGLRLVPFGDDPIFG